MYKKRNSLWSNRAIWDWIWRNNGEPVTDPPSPTSTQIITETGDVMISETGDLLFTEGA